MLWCLSLTTHGVSAHVWQQLRVRAYVRAYVWQQHIGGSSFLEQALFIQSCSVTRLNVMTPTLTAVSC